jgi:hypothetical protein
MKEDSEKEEEMEKVKVKRRAEGVMWEECEKLGGEFEEGQGNGRWWWKGVGGKKLEDVERKRR